MVQGSNTDNGLSAGTGTVRAGWGARKGAGKRKITDETGEDWAWGDGLLSSKDMRIILLSAGHDTRNDEEKPNSFLLFNDISFHNGVTIPTEINCEDRTLNMDNQTD